MLGCRSGVYGSSKVVFVDVSNTLSPVGENPRTLVDWDMLKSLQRLLAPRPVHSRLLWVTASETPAMYILWWHLHNYKNTYNKYSCLFLSNSLSLYFVLFTLSLSFPWDNSRESGWSVVCLTFEVGLLCRARPATCWLCVHACVVCAYRAKSL